MPTSTLPFEVLFEFTNDTPYPATLHSTHALGESPSNGAMILLHPDESVSLVLSAGSIYRYIVEQQTRRAEITVRAWQDVQCNVRKVLAADCVCGPSHSDVLLQGITVTCFGNGI